MKCIGLTAGVVLLVAGMSGMATAQNETRQVSTDLVSARLVESDAPDDATGVAQSGGEQQSVATAASEGPCIHDAGKPWKLPQPACLQNAGVNVGGWIEQGFSQNSLGYGDGFNGPIATDDQNGKYQLNQAWLFFDRPTKTDGCGWDLGGRVDVVYGSDWRFGQCYGLETTFDSKNSIYGLILPQFYTAVAVDDLTVKMGHFATMSSLEVIPAPANFFYSHSLLSCGYFDPLLVTGLQADYKLSDHWTVFGGFNRGWMMFEDPNDSLNYLGGFKWTSDDKRSNLMVNVDVGPQDGFTGEHNRTSVITVYTRQITKKLQYGSQYTVGKEYGGSVINPGQDASWYGTEQLFTYQLNDKWAAGLRYEWVRDNDGSRVAGVGNVLLPDKGWNGQPGMAGNYNDLTLGLTYRPRANLVLRPEARWDWYAGEPNGAGQLPFGNHSKRDQFLAAVDLIWTF